MEKSKQIQALFEGWEETLLYSCLQGVLGTVITDDDSNPKSAAAIIADFVFFAGQPDLSLIRRWQKHPEARSFTIAVPQSSAWQPLMEQALSGTDFRKVTRYAIKKEPEVFDPKLLWHYVEKLPNPYTLAQIDEPLYRYCRDVSWCRDFVRQFDSYEQYRKHGLGFVILKDGLPVSGASSYTYYPGGIEIEIDTQEAYRRQGLATVCGARLILACLERGLYPSWDAQILWSVRLAEKFGYHFSHEYTAYEIVQ